MAKELTKNRYSPKTALARKMFEDIKDLPERDGVDGVSNEYYLRKIMEYIDYLEKVDKPPTIAGLALFIGVCRATLMGYARQDEYAPSIGRFKQIIEMTLEENWIDGEGGATSIFLGKNMGYTDKQTVEVEHVLSEASLEELDMRQARLEAILSGQTTSGPLSLEEQANGGRTELTEDTEVEAVYEVIEDERD